MKYEVTLTRTHTVTYDCTVFVDADDEDMACKLALDADNRDWIVVDDTSNFDDDVLNAELILDADDRPAFADHTWSTV